MTGRRALPQPIVALGVEEPLFGKPRQLELMVHIGSEYKKIFGRYQRQQVALGLSRLYVVAIHPDGPRPPGPVFFQRLVGVKAAAIHVADAVGTPKVCKVLLEVVLR